MSDDENLPAEILEAYENASESILPAKSKSLYEKCYNSFIEWQKEKKVKSFGEPVMMAYFLLLSDTMKLKPSTLWSKYSMLKRMLIIRHNVDIENFAGLQSFLKQMNAGYRPKKSKVLTAEQVDKFLNEAPEDVHLVTKVALIFGVYGALRSGELVNVTVEDVLDRGEYFRIDISVTKTKISKFFVVEGPLYATVKKYTNLRPSHCMTNRFFINYQKGRCTIQPIGKNKLGGYPSEVAAYLQLPDAKLYTGHCYRRTSATLLANARASTEEIMRHGCWKSRAAADGYIEDSVTYKKITATITSSNSEENKSESPEPSSIPFGINVANCSNCTFNLQKK